MYLRLFLNNNVETELIETQLPNDNVYELELEDLLPDFGTFDFKTTLDLKPKSFAQLQLRARNAVRALLRDNESRVLLLCGSSCIDNLGTAQRLVSEVASFEVPIIYQSKKIELFGKDGNSGILGAGGIFILNAAIILNHPQWLFKLDELLSRGNLRLILCADACDASALQLLWPTVENALHADLVLEFVAQGGGYLMGSLVADFCKRYKLKPFDAKAIELLCTYSCRQSGDRRWIGLPELKLRSLCCEASVYAKNAIVGVRDVLKAIAADDFRANYLAESQLRDHRDRQILIATSGEVVGQINGLSVIETSGTSYEYGEPVRITATLRAGGEGDVIDIERKAELAGQIHAKAMMIINGYLTREFGYEQPLPLSASLVFEQSYSEIDGDSASLTGLCAVISAFANVPIRQDLAVTGAVDQFGDVQPVGGVNEKIEGFFRICRLNGLTGTQGVVIPKSCVSQLVLRPSVLNAVKKGLFHIYAVEHVKGAVKILTSIPWGQNDDENTVCGSICARLDELSLNRDHRPWWHFWP